jgi:hypothetical protein
MESADAVGLVDDNLRMRVEVSVSPFPKAH